MKLLLVIRADCLIAAEHLLFWKISKYDFVEYVENLERFFFVQALSEVRFLLCQLFRRIITLFFRFPRTVYCFSARMSSHFAASLSCWTPLMNRIPFPDILLYSSTLHTSPHLCSTQFVRKSIFCVQLMRLMHHWYRQCRFLSVRGLRSVSVRLNRPRQLSSMTWWSFSNDFALLDLSFQTSDFRLRACVIDPCFRSLRRVDYLTGQFCLAQQ